MSALQEGIDAATAIDEPGKMDSGGASALNKLRIGSLDDQVIIWLPFKVGDHLESNP